MKNTMLRNGFLGFNAFGLNIPPYHKMSSTIEYIGITRADGFYAARISMGTVGTYHLGFQSLSVQQKLGVGMQVGREEWSYKDLITSEPIDFYDPFSKT